MLKKARTFRTFDHKKRKGEITTKESMTQPDQSVSLKTILKRHGVEDADRISQEYLTQDAALRTLMKDIDVRVGQLSKLDKVNRALEIRNIGKEVKNISKEFTKQQKLIEAEHAEYMEKQRQRQPQAPAEQPEDQKAESKKDE